MSSNSSKKIKVEGLNKSFKEVVALKDINVNFEYGKIYGLLGRNGAGKSTLLNVITNKLFSDTGSILINGEHSAENDKAQRNVYLMSEKNYFPETFKVKDVFKWTKEFYGTFDDVYAQGLCERFGLNTKKKIKELSTGYTSIYKIITALSLTDVDFIFFDEPILGLDANHRELFYKILIENYANNPKTFVISTHIIEEIASIIEDVIIIKNGEIIRNQSCESLLSVGYSVSGTATEIDQYIKGKTVISQDILGGLKTAYMIGDTSKEKIPDTLQVGDIDLQKLFVRLTDM